MRPESCTNYRMVGIPKETQAGRGTTSRGRRDGRHVLVGAPVLEGEVLGGFTILKVPVDGGEPTTLLTSRLTGMRDFVRDLRLSPDGRRLAFVAGEGRQEVWLMEGF